tara:strand:- start:2215 stop:3342 length:1128 start_codon:yes stop_codon:yes gene_type:complete
MHKIVNFYGIGKPGTGYGDACLNIARAFEKSSVDVNFNFSRFKKIAESNNISGSNIEGDINFFIGPPPYIGPNNKSIVLSRNKYNIVYFYWEADRLPAYWKKHILSANEVWAPCKLVRDACIKMGFLGKIREVPTPYEDIASLNSDMIDIPSQISNEYFVSEDVFKFYSIFQWHHRKGPDVLLKSYWKSFDKNDSVILILKVSELGLPGYKKNDIRNDIYKIKSRLNLKYYPPVFVIDDFLPKKYIRAIHDTADCYVSPHRGEGWGMPISEAILHNNPVLITKYGGISDYLDKNTAGIIRHKMTPVRNMEWSPKIYNKSQMWAEPSINITSHLMRDAYDNFNKYKIKAGFARNVIKDFSIKNLSKKIEGYICEID